LSFALDPFLVTELTDLVLGATHCALYYKARERMAKPTQTAKAEPTPAAPSKKSLKQLFDERDRTRTGSREEEQAAEKILETIFPDTNAD
jgi:hypothetical protein